MVRKDLNSWEEFERELAKLRRDREDRASTSKGLLFRGQANCNWTLTTTLDRKRQGMLFKDYYRLISRLRPQIESLTDNDWPIPEYPEIERLCREYDAFNLQMWSGPRPAYAYMAYLRHHGFPSPLLDWTRSPYVAAYFALSRAAEDSNGRASIYALSDLPNKTSGNKMPILYRFGPYVKTHRRHVLQQSEYTLCLVFDEEWRFEDYDRVFEENYRQQGVCWKFTIPVSEQENVLRVLDEHNLNALSLFETDDAMMETLAAREFYFKGKDVLPTATRDPSPVAGGLGTEIAALFSDTGLNMEVPEIRGSSVELNRAGQHVGAAAPLNLVESIRRHLEGVGGVELPDVRRELMRSSHKSAGGNSKKRDSAPSSSPRKHRR
jgi:hypothetical protein